jgi:hypothetical protein
MSNATARSRVEELLGGDRKGFGLRRERPGIPREPVVVQLGDREPRVGRLSWTGQHEVLKEGVLGRTERSEARKQQTSGRDDETREERKRQAPGPLRAIAGELVFGPLLEESRAETGNVFGGRRGTVDGDLREAARSGSSSSGGSSVQTCRGAGAG